MNGRFKSIYCAARQAIALRNGMYGLQDDADKGCVLMIDAGNIDKLITAMADIAQIPRDTSDAFVHAVSDCVQSLKEAALNIGSDTVSRVAAGKLFTVFQETGQSLGEQDASSVRQAFVDALAKYMPDSDKQSGLSRLQEMSASLQQKLINQTGMSGSFSAAGSAINSANVLASSGGSVSRGSVVSGGGTASVGAATRGLQAPAGHRPRFIPPPV